MRIGDVGYTRVVDLDTAGTTSELIPIQFAVGIKVRALMTRITAWMNVIGAVTGSDFIFFENGQAIAAGATFQTILADNRAHVVFAYRQTLVTSGFPAIVGPVETEWWKILLPDVQFIAVSKTVSSEVKCSIHYRFAELSDDEIVEIAAQRAQG